MNSENPLFLLPELILDTILLNLSVNDLLNLRLTCKEFYNYLSNSNKTIWMHKFGEMVHQSPVKTSRMNDLFKSSNNKCYNFMECCIRMGRIYSELMTGGTSDRGIAGCRTIKTIVLRIETPQATYWTKKHLQSHRAYLAVGTFSPSNSPSKKVFFCAPCELRSQQDSSPEDLTIHPGIPSLHPTLPDPDDQKACCKYMQVYQDPVQLVLKTLTDYMSHYQMFLHQVDLVRFTPSYQPKIHINPIIWTETDLMLRLIKPTFHLTSPLEFFNSQNPDVSVISEYLDHILKARHSYKTKDYFPSANFYFYEPFCCTAEHRKVFTQLLFEKFRVRRVCLISPLHLLAQSSPDPAILIHTSYCNTVVRLHRGGQLVGLQHYPSGMATVASYLYDILSKKEDTKFVAPHYLLHDAILHSCCLRYSHKYPLKGHAQVYVQDIWPGSLSRKISLGPERYQVPERVYEEINFPAMVGHLVHSLLTPEEARVALSHVVVTGAFSSINGFQLRLEIDLARYFPQWSRAVCVHLRTQEDISDLQQLTYSTMPKIQGTEFWLPQEEYILFGSSIFDH